MHAGRFRCGEGCDACCRSPFAITEIEAAAVSRAVATMPEQLASRLKRRAADYLSQRLAVFAQHGYRQSRGELAPEPERLACPALIAGRCTIYEQRPTLCRRFGGALMHSDCADRVFACQLNFAPGERIDDPQLTARQEELALLSEELCRAYFRSGGRSYSEPITVAHALLEDFQRYLPGS